jgi:hypothetical protein
MAVWLPIRFNSASKSNRGGVGNYSPFFIKEEQMTNNEQVWLKTNEEKLRSLLADEAKMVPMLDNMMATIKQLKAKQTFRIALLNQLLEDSIDETKY